MCEKSFIMIIVRESNHTTSSLWTKDKCEIDISGKRSRQYAVSLKLIYEYTSI